MRLPLLLFLVSVTQANELSYLLAPVIPAQTSLVSIPLKATSGVCNDQVLHTAQYNFNTMLGIPTEADWTNSEVFSEAIQSILIKGPEEGLLKVCAARSKFYSTLGATYDDCISRFHFLRQGFTLAEATRYVQIFKELEFMCNGGLLQALKKWDCIMTTRTKESQTINRCLAAFENETASSSDQFCRKAETLIICVRAPIQIACDKDAGWFECEIMRTKVEFDNYCPSLTCSYSLFPGNTGNSAKLLTRAQLFKSPNPYFMRKELQDLYALMGSKAAERAKRKKREAEAVLEE